jgi:hypothetical protein
MSTALKPGWRMTEDQHRKFWRLWSDACEYQRWTALPAKDCEQKRREISSGLGFSSAKRINTTSGFDRVKKHLEALAGHVHNESPDAGQRRRIISRIGQVMSELTGAGYPHHSLDTILRVRFKVIEGIRTITDLETPELVNLSRTLTARLSAWKQQPGPDSQAEPSSAAGVALVGAMHTLCNNNADHLQAALMATPDLFFQAD